MLDPTFAAALENGIRKAQGTALLKIGASTALASAFWGWCVLEHRPPYAIIPGVVLLGVGWWLVFTGKTPAVLGLTRLRGAAVEAWFPSPSHGLVAVTGGGVAVGKIGLLSLNPSEKARLFGFAYDETAHAFVLTVHVVKRGRDGEFTDVKQHRVKLSAETTAERAYDAARTVDARTSP